MLVCTGAAARSAPARTRPRPRFSPRRPALVGALLAARYLLGLAAVRLVERDAPGPIDLLLWALFLVALVWLALDLIERRRVACAAAAPATRHWSSG